MSRSAVDCIYYRSLEIPYIHLEDFFIVGFGGQVCQVPIYNDSGFHSLGSGKTRPNIGKWDILFHYAKESEFESVYRKKINAFDYNVGKCKI